MRLIECPACAYGFVYRRGKRCPRKTCRALLVYEGEGFYAGDEPFFVWSSEGWLLSPRRTK